MSAIPPFPPTETHTGIRLEHFRIVGEVEPSWEPEPDLPREKPRLPPLVAPPAPGPFLVGPSGGTGGADFECGPVPAGAVIREIHVRHDHVIRALGVGYAYPGEKVERLPVCGGTPGRDSIVRLREDEYVTQICGTYGQFVDSLEIITNRGFAGRFGGAGGRVAYQYYVPDGLELCGLGGRCSSAIDAMGLMFRPGTISRLYQQGPAGDPGGEPFDDPPLGTKSRITGVVIHHTDDSVLGIGLRYEEDGRTGLRFHGSRMGRAVELELQRDEYLVGIGGWYSGDGIRGVRIFTDRRVSLSYGCEDRQLPFMFKTRKFDDRTPGRYEIVGLLGRAGWRLNALGVKFRLRA